MPFCSCLPVISVGVEDTSNAETLAMDSTRGEVWSFVMMGLAYSCRRVVLQRAARGDLACSLLGDNEPVRTTSGPTPCRSIREKFQVVALSVPLMKLAGPLVLTKVTSTRPYTGGITETRKAYQSFHSKSALVSRRQQTSACVVSTRHKKQMPWQMPWHFTSAVVTRHGRKQKVLSLV